MSEKKLAVMVDIETLGLGDDAVIIEIGAVMFWRHQVKYKMGADRCVQGDSYHAPIQIHEGQEDRKIDHGTLCWHMGDAARAEYFLEHVANPDLIPFQFALEDFFEWLIAQAGACEVVMADVEVWAKGDFDLRILKHAAKSRGLTVPWAYHQARELRTVLKWAGVNGNSADTVHRALDDARRQVELLEVAEGILAHGSGAF